VKVKLLSRVQLLATPWTAAYQAPQSMGFSRWRREKEGNKMFENIIAKSFPNLGKERDIKLKEALGILNRIKAKGIIRRHTVSKMPKTND